MAAIAVSRHEKYLRELRCAVSRSIWVTLHHCHGGSMKLYGWHVGIGQKQNPFLQIPLSIEYHTGNNGIDSGYGVKNWERDWGTQVEHLQWVNEQLPYDLFWMAEVWERKNRSTGIAKLPIKD